MLDNPDKYGVKNTTSYCSQYNAPDTATNYAAYGWLKMEEYFWSNTGHNMWKVHDYLASAVEEFLLGQKC